MGTLEIPAWEYKVINIGPSTSTASEQVLNDLGSEGWEMIAFQPSDFQAYPGEGTFYFKRQRRGTAK